MSGIKIISKNRKAYHDFHIGDTLEAGIALTGTEVKSIRAGKINLSDGWVNLTSQEEAFLEQVHISPYSHGHRDNHPEKRVRKLLLKKKEIRKLGMQTSSKGYTIVPTKVYLKGRLIKVEIALAKGKKAFDKRETAKAKDAAKDIERAMKKRVIR